MWIERLTKKECSSCDCEVQVQIVLFSWNREEKMISSFKGKSRLARIWKGDLFKKKKIIWVWWHTPFNLSTQVAEAGRSEFEDNLVYIVRSRTARTTVSKVLFFFLNQLAKEIEYSFFCVMIVLINIEELDMQLSCLFSCCFISNWSAKCFPMSVSLLYLLLQMTYFIPQARCCYVHGEV